MVKPFSKQIFLMEMPVAGCNHVRRIKSYLREIEIGDRLILLREPQNEYDDLAILVNNEKGHKLGYIPRKNNQIIARLMDVGKLIYGVVTAKKSPEDDGFPWNAVTVAVYMED